MSFIVDAIGNFLGHDEQANQAHKSISDFQNAVQWSNQAGQDARQAELGYFQPTYDVGLSNLQGANAMLQPGYNFQTSDPSYQWRLGQGLDAVQGSAAANGLLHSGGTLKALNNYAQGAASQEFQNEFARRNTLGSYTPDATRGLATAQQSYADNALRAYFAGAQGMAGARGVYGDAQANKVGDITAGLTGNLSAGRGVNSIANNVASFFGF